MQTQARVLAGLALAAVRKIGERLRAATQQRELHCAAQARFDQSFQLQTSRVLITGSTRGIGLALAEAFVRRKSPCTVEARPLRALPRRRSAPPQGPARTPSAWALTCRCRGQDGAWCRRRGMGWVGWTW